VYGIITVVLRLSERDLRRVKAERSRTDDVESRNTLGPLSGSSTISSYGMVPWRSFLSSHEAESMIIPRK